MKFRCACGEVLNTSVSPHPEGFLLVTEVLLDQVESTPPPCVSEAIDRVNEVSVQAYRCPVCDRLLVFERGRGTAPALYRRESGT